MRLFTPTNLAAVLASCLLCGCGAGPASAQQFRPTRLCEAIVAGDLQTATRLIERGADVNAGNGCALIAAVSRKLGPMVQALLERGAEPNRKATGDLTLFLGGTTPLVTAIQSRDLQMVRLLLEHGADPGDDFEAFSIVLNFNDTEMAALLLRFGADPNMMPPPNTLVFATVSTTEGNRTVGRQVIVPETDLLPERIDDTARRWQCDLSGESRLLHQAVGPVGVGSPEGDRVVQLLIEGGADPNSIDLNGSTPLMIAASQQNHAAIVLLMDAGANVSATDRCGRTAHDYIELYPRNQRIQLAQQTRDLLAGR